MTHADLITFNRFVARLPATFGRVPRMLRGLYYTAIRNREKSLSLGWALERAARLYPDNPAVLDGQRRISYALFNGWANRLARAFKAEGVGHGSVVAVMLENRVELLAILAALAKLGAIGALVNTTQRGKVLVHSLNLVKPGHFVVGEECGRCSRKSVRRCSATPAIATGSMTATPSAIPARRRWAGAT